jgi:hypothetical protein
MSELERFLPADQDLLISLFYRIGQWMSQVDDTDGGEDSEQIEEAQMFKILNKLSQSKNVGLLCSEIAAEALRQKGSWARWSKQIDTVINDVSRAKALIKAQANQQEFVAFGKSLVTIATAVARAYREAEDVETEEKGFLSWLSEKKDHVVLALTDAEGHKDLNISPAEDSALTELVFALKN